ncbi:MAG: outer membrane protein assembly factor BamD [Pseudomonadota bacterium]
MSPTLAPRSASRMGRLALAALALVYLSGCGLFGKEEDPTRNWSEQRLYQAGKSALEGGDYEKAIDFYQKLETRYPFGPFAQQAQLESSFAYYKTSEPASAVAAADRFIKLNPQHPNVDYAYYMKGLAQFDQGRGFIDRISPMDPSQRDPGSALASFEDFQELVQRYPNSRYAKDARQRMLYLRNNLARYELHVANYYMRRGAFVAAANRAKYVIENYDEAPAVPEALAVMAKAYKVMGLNDLSAVALRVLILNFPDDPRIAEVESLQLE